MNKAEGELIKVMIRGYSVPQSASWKAEEANPCSIVGAAGSPQNKKDK